MDVILAMVLKMGHRIIKQPNGKYAVFSTAENNFILTNVTVEEIIQQ